MSFPRQLRTLAARHREPELMDQPGLDEATHRRALAGLARINWWSRSARIFWPELRRLARATPSQRVRVLDVACGGGDVTLAVARLARRAGLPFEIAGVDISATALNTASERAQHAGFPIDFRQLDVLSGDLSTGFDAVICSLFLHHLDTQQAGSLLQRMAAATTRLVLVNDLIRSRFNYCLAIAATRLFSRSHVVHVDGPLSVAAAFTPDEALELAHQAGLIGARISRHWPQRFLLSWKKF